jgi:hypothetical protein
VIWQPGVSRPVGEDAKKEWDARVDRADHIRKQHEPLWERALERYTRSKADNYEVNALLDFRHVESKKAQLFYQTPEVQLHPIDPSNPELPVDAILPLRQKMLNDRLGPDGTNVKRTVHEALFDALAPSGFLATEIGYDVRLAPAPLDEAGNPLVGPDGQPMTEIPVWGRAFWSRFSPKKLLVPADFRSTNFDEAPWLGVKLTMPLSRAKREFKLPDDFSGSAQKDDALFTHEEQTSQTGGDPLVEYVKVWYRAELYDDTILNPELYRLLYLVKGHDQAIERDSPFQAVDEMGQLTPDSMRGNPIHLGTLRDLSDSAFIKSDLAVGEQLSNEVNKFRTGLIKNRVARTPITLIDPQGLPDPSRKAIENGEKTVFTEPGALANAGANGIIAVAQVGTEPRDNYSAQDYAERDWQGALGSSDNSNAQVAKKKTTATEARIVATSVSARSEAEKDRLREWFIAGVRKFDSVLQKTMTQADLVKVLGTQGAALWEQWRALPGCYVYKILPDSGVHVDAAQFRAQKIDEYNMLRKDPQVNATELLKTTARALGHDPAKMVIEQAPEAGPDPIKTSFAFKGEDLIGPQSQAVVEILAQMGISVSTDAIATLQAAQMTQMQGMADGTLGPDGKPAAAPNAPATHGGSAPKTEPINQHQRERTGGVQGVAA